MDHILVGSICRSSALARPIEFGEYIFFIWMGELVEYFSDDTGGLCAAVRDLMLWVSQGFELLLLQSEASVAGEVSDESSDKGDDPTPVFRMRKVNDDVIEVNFEDETGSISGMYAFRLQQLIVQRRIHALELGGDTMVADSRQSTLASAETIETDIDQSLPSNGNARLAQIRDELGPLRARHAQLTDEIADATSSFEREELESKMQRVLERINQVRRAEPSAMNKARARVDRGFKRLLEEVLSMPKFYRHLERSLGFDKLLGDFIYAPEQLPAWDFMGF